MNHFVIGRFKRLKRRARFLPDKVYAKVRDSIVRTCVEALLMDEKRVKILLGKRNIRPWPHWWTFGGRMIAGESPERAVSRVVKEDLGLKISPERFIFLDTMSLVFSRREELPQENGCHDLSLFFLLAVNKRENEEIHFRKSEYQKIKWFNSRDIAKKPRDIAKREGFHPATAECLEKALRLRRKTY